MSKTLKRERSQSMASKTDPENEDSQTESAAEAFDQLLRDALASLHDLPYLQTHPLAALQPESSDTAAMELAKMLRDRLLAAIENLRPDPGQGVIQDRALRRHELMTLRYVEGLEVRDVYEEIGYSRADYFRQLKIGIDSVGEYLRKEFTTGSAPAPNLIALGHQSPLVGRDRELETMKFAYDAAASGSGGSVIMISGEQGLGKTRLAHELGRYVQSQGGVFIEGRWLLGKAAPHMALWRRPCDVHYETSSLMI